MKKHVYVVLAVLLCGTMLLSAACGGQTSDPSGDISSDIIADNSSTTTSVADTGDGSDSTAADIGDGSDSTGTPAGDPTGDSSNPNGSTTTDIGSQGNQGKNPTESTTKTSSNTSATTRVKDTAVRDLKGRTITYCAYWEEPKKGSSANANTYWKVKESVEKEFNCKIKFIFKSRPAVDTEIIPSILSGKPVADVFTTDGYRIFGYIKKKLLYPLNELPQFDFSEDKWNPSTTQNYTFNGKVYAMGIAQKPYMNTGILYNKDYFKEQKIDDPFKLQSEGKWNWANFRRVAKEATKGNVFGYTHYSIPGEAIQTFYYANQASVAERDETGKHTTTVVSRNMINALQFYQDMYTKDKSIGYCNSLDAGQQAFEAGKAAMFQSPSWQWTTVLNNANFEVGFVLFPAGPDSTHPYYITSSTPGYVIPANVQNPEDVAAVLDRYLGADVTKDWEAYYFDLFYNEEVIETLRLGEELLHSGLKLKLGTFLPDLYEIGYFGSLASVANGELTPVQAVEAMQGAIQAAVDKVNGDLNLLNATN